jgi:hypothetical protein
MSNPATTQIKVTLPQELYGHLKARAGKFGLNLSAYIRHLVINDVDEANLPTYKMSPKTEKVLEKALADHKAGKTKRIDDLDEYFARIKRNGN